MFQNAFGDATWSKGLRYYLTAKKLHSAVPDDLYAGIKTAVHEDNPTVEFNVAQAMKSWELQSGFPYLNVTRTDTTLKFEQNRFMYDNRNSSNLWWIPINYVVGSNPNYSSTAPDFWLEGIRSMTFEQEKAPKPLKPDDLIIVNIKQSGFYRVNYDTTLWNQIIAQLNGKDFKKIHLFNRAQLIDDSFNLARADLIDFRIPLKIMKYLEKEIDFMPWTSARSVNEILDRWLIGTNIYPRYQAYMRKNVLAFYNRFGLDVVKNESRVNKYSRIIAINIACQAQLQSCLTQTNQRLNNMLESQIAIHQDLIPPIYCNGMRVAGVATFNAMKSKLLQSTVPNERLAIISGISCTQNTALLKFLLLFAVESASPLSKPERQRIISTSISVNGESLLAIIEFLQDNYKAVNASGLVPFMSHRISESVSNQQHFNQFALLLTFLKTKALLTTQQVASYTINARKIVAWQAKNLKSIERFFEAQDETTTTTLHATATKATTKSNQKIKHAENVVTFIHDLPTGANIWLNVIFRARRNLSRENVK